MPVSDETIKRVIDDLETKVEETTEKGGRTESSRIKFFAYGKGSGLEYAVKQLRQALQDG